MSNPCIVNLKLIKINKSIHKIKKKCKKKKKYSQLKGTVGGARTRDPLPVR